MKYSNTSKSVLQYLWESTGIRLEEGKSEDKAGFPILPKGR